VARNKFPHVKVARNTEKVGQVCLKLKRRRIALFCSPSLRPPEGVGHDGDIAFHAGRGAEVPLSRTTHSHAFFPVSGRGGSRLQVMKLYLRELLWYSSAVVIAQQLMLS